MKVLFLQSKPYYDELGVDYSQCKARFGLPLCFSAEAELKKYDLVVSCVEHDIQARKIIKLANALNIPTAFILDGVYDLSNARRNAFAEKYNITYLQPALYGTVFCVGKDFIGWYEQMYKGVKVYEYTPLRAALEFDGPRHVDRKVVLITTAMTPYFDDQELDVLVEWLKVLIAFLKRNKIEYRARIFDEKILELVPGLVEVNDVVITLSAAVSEVSCVISTSSTVLYSCELYGISNILLNYRQEKVFYPVGVIVDAIDEISCIDFEYAGREAIKPKLGLSIQHYSYGVADILEKNCRDFFNMSLSFYFRALYKELPSGLRAIIKRVLS